MFGARNWITPPVCAMPTQCFSDWGLVMMVASEETRTDVAQTVRDSLQECHPGGVTLSVIESDIRKIDDWWRVPVRPSEEPKHTFEYYDALARVEEEISEKTRLKVLLVPAMLDLATQE